MSRYIGTFALLLLALAALRAQTIYRVDASAGAELGRISSMRSSRSSLDPGALANSQERVYAKVVSGDGWETTVVLLNMGANLLKFRQFFMGPDGESMHVTLRSGPDSRVLTTAAVEGTLDPNSTLSLTVSDIDGPFREGWALLSCDGAQGRLGGYATIRRRARSGDFYFETIVPLSAMQDFSQYMPFDNTKGFRTHLTLVNPAVNLAAQVRLTYLSPVGEVLLIDSLIMKPAQQTTIILPDSYPDLANKTGMVFVEANINRFSAVGLRVNELSGAIASVPRLEVRSE